MKYKIGCAALLLGAMGLVSSAAASENAVGVAEKRVQPPVIILLIKALVLVLASVASSPSYARCRFIPLENGFIHARQHLPVNAKGILFRLDGPPNAYWLRNNKIAGFKFVPLVPSALSVSDFSITESASGKHLTPVLTRLPLGILLGLPQGKYFASKNRRLTKCATDNLFSLDGCEEIESKVEQLVARGVLYDATENLKKAYGTFRLSAAEGFVPGKEYVVQYSGALKDSEGLHYLRASNIVIDEKTVPQIESGDIKLVMDKGMVKYELPATIRPYQDSMFFFTKRDFGVGTKLRVRPLRECESQPSPLGSDSGTYRAEDEDFRQCHNATVKAGFFELQDSLSESQVLRVNCP